MSNVLIFTDSYDGGVKTHIDILKNNKKSDLIYTCILSKEENDLCKNEKEYFIKFQRNKVANYLKAITELIKIIKLKKIETVHAHSSVAGILSVFIKIIKPKVKIIYTPHAYFSQNMMLNKKTRKLILLIEKAIVFTCVKVIHVSKDEENHAISNKIIKNKSKSTVIYNGIETPTLEKRLSNYESSKLTIVNVARVEDQKNPYLFIKIAEEVIKINKDIVFIYIGDGKLRMEINNYINKNNLSENILFVGKKNKAEVYQFLNEATLYFSSSLYEGLPYSVIEAMANKLPLYLSNVIGHRELIDNNGVLFNINENPKLIASSMLSLLNDGIKIKKFKKNSYNNFKLYFSEESMIEETIKIYNSQKNGEF